MTDKDRNYLLLKSFCQQQGIDLFGVADISSIKNEFALSMPLPERLNRGVVLGVRLSQGILDEISTYPTRLYFHHYRTVNTFLDQSALRLANFIQDKGFTAIPIPASQIIDWQNQKAHLSHKKLGVLAGLGWIGRNNLLVNPELGSQFRLVSILTDMQIEPDKPLNIFGCGDCRLCIQACPCGAIKETPAEFDHLRCFEKLKGFQKQHLVDQYICGICVSVCKGSKR